MKTRSTGVVAKTAFLSMTFDYKLASKEGLMCACSPSVQGVLSRLNYPLTTVHGGRVQTLDTPVGNGVNPP